LTGKRLKEVERDYERIACLNEELKEAKVVAEAGVRSRSSFIATMSHEIRSAIPWEVHAVLRIEDAFVRCEVNFKVENCSA
jgi:hypothetical protein